jgi:hypothetical protein
LVTHYNNKVLLAKMLQKAGWADQEIGRILKQPPFISQSVSPYGFHVSETHMRRILKLLLSARLRKQTGRRGQCNSAAGNLYSGTENPRFAQKQSEFKIIIDNVRFFFYFFMVSPGSAAAGSAAEIDFFRRNR